jgi:hypothetical protein
MMLGAVAINSISKIGKESQFVVLKTTKLIMEAQPSHCVGRCSPHN